MKIDNFYFVVKNISNSIDFYSNLLGSKPTNIAKDLWADWGNENGKVYFGVLSEKAAQCESIKGNNGVLGLYTDNLDEAYKKCLELNAKILYEPENVPASKEHYRCFAIEDPDGNKIEISYYDR